MPTKSRSKPPRHPRRAIVELSDGWSVVTNSNGRSSKPSTSSTSLDPDADYSAPNAHRVSEIIAEAETHLERWRLSKCAASLRQMIHGRKARARQSIDNAICAGLGSLNSESVTHGKTRMWQFAVFLWLVEEVKTEVTTNIKLYAQEPRFTPTDVLVLEHFGIQILPDLDGKAFVTSRTLLYAPFLPWSLLLKDFLQGGSPAICISIDIEANVEWLQIQLKHGSDSLNSEGVLLQNEDLRVCERVGSAFLQGKEAFAFPPFEFHSECLKLMIYLEESQFEAG